MLKEKCCREINDSLQKMFARSILKQFAQNLNVDIDNGGGGSTQMHSREQNKLEEKIPEDVDPMDESDLEEALEIQEKRASFQEFVAAGAKGDIKKQSKIVKKYCTQTEQDMQMHRRQKNGQLRFGDVICLGYQEDIFLSLNEAVPKSPLKALAGGDASKAAEKKPDYKYKGLLYSDGVTDKGIKMIPQTSQNSQNASNLFKQCLFRLEVVQDCEVNKRNANLQAMRTELEEKLKKMIKDNGGEQNVDAHQLKLIKKEIESAIEDIRENDKRKIIQEENNAYEQNYRHGTKLTYGTPCQLKHLFSGRYLTLNLNEMSQEYGSCELFLNESTEQSQFVIEPHVQIQNTSGYVVNYQDFFCIRSLNSSTPFSFHIYEKPNGEFTRNKTFLLNASLEPSPLKARLFMSFSESIKAKDFIQSGDVIRLRHFEVDGYLTTSSVVVDDLLPDLPDFLKGQIRRMHSPADIASDRIERSPGGLDKQYLTKDEQQQAAYCDKDFTTEIVNDDYVKKLKAKSSEDVYIEERTDRIKFTNSCWEIQRVNPLNGGNIVLEEVIRLRHVGTGKFLAVSADGGFESKDIKLVNSNYSLSTLFKFRSDMSNMNPTRFLDEDGDGVVDDVKLMQNNQRVMIQSFYNERYLQLLEDIEGHQDEADVADAEAEQLAFNIEDPNESRLQVINHKFMKQGKQKMIFYIEEVSEENAISSYQSACMFDELLEFYALLNQWGVVKVEQDDTTEKFYYKHARAVELKQLLHDKVSKLMFIIGNLENRIKASQQRKNEEELRKCKGEIADQGILDILLCIVEMLYLKATPPIMFQKAFSSKSSSPSQSGSKGGKSTEDMKAVRILDFQAQNIARDATAALQMQVLEIVLSLIHDHQSNSEKVTKYFGMLFQQFTVHQQYELLQLHWPRFKAHNPKGFQYVIGQIFNNAQADSVYVMPDRSVYTLMVAHEEHLRAVTNNFKNFNKKGQSVHSPAALDIAAPHSVDLKSIDPGLIKQWSDLLEPVKYQDETSQNIDNQIMILDMLANFCRDQHKRGVYPYQRQISEQILTEEHNFLIRFGTAKVDGCLRPYIYFVRPQTVSLNQFIEQNPILGEIHDTKFMQQHNNQKASFDLIFDLHEFSKNHGSTEKNTQPYIDYICSVVNLYAYMCLSSNQEAIRRVQQTGLTESHISLCIHLDKEKLVIHEKMKTAYMFLARVLFIENDPISSSIVHKNRVYVWDRLHSGEDQPLQEEERENEDFEDLIENDEYAGKTQKKKEADDDKKQAMIVLTSEQESQNMMVIQLIKQSALWFLQDGPEGTIGFFSHNGKKNFTAKSIYTKLNSLLTYLETIYSIVQKDLIDKNFVEQAIVIATCVQFGSLHLSPGQKEQKIPFVVTSNWVYQLMWISKECVYSSGDTALEDANKAIECKCLDILNKIAHFRLNNHMMIFLKKFRKFQEQAIDPLLDDAGEPSSSTIKSYNMQDEFEAIFKEDTVSVLDKPFCELLADAKRRQISKHLSTCSNQQCQADQFLKLPDRKENQTSLQFELFLDYIFHVDTRQMVREKALQTLIGKFNQKEALSKELITTSLIVSTDDYEAYTFFLKKQRILRQFIQSMIQNETIQTILQEKPSQETKNIKNNIILNVREITSKLCSFKDAKRMKFQNTMRYIKLVDDLLYGLLKKLENKMFYYRDLFQEIVNFLLEFSKNNSFCQKLLLKDLNFFVDMINQRIESGLLISEIIKSNSDSENGLSFVNYLIEKIIGEGYFKSTLFHLLIKLADNNETVDGGENEIPRNQNQENSNQQNILKRMVSNSRFRSLLLMKKQFTSTKIGIIKAYCKKKDLQNQMQKEADTELIRDKEALDLHLAVVDLLASCARNNPYGISQAQKLIQLDELLDSILSDAIPYLIKKHYFNLLFEIYLRKVPGVDASERLNVGNIRLQQVLDQVISFDLDKCYQYYTGLVKNITPSSQDEKRYLNACVRDITKVAELEHDDKHIISGPASEEQRIDIEKAKAVRETLCSWKDQLPIFVLDNEDHSEYWRYLFDEKESKKQSNGLLSFITNFYNDYNKKDFGDDDGIYRMSYNIRQKLLNLAQKIFLFIDTHEDFIKEDCHKLLIHLNEAVQKIPNSNKFAHEDEGHDENEGHDHDHGEDISVQIDNRMSGEKVIRILSSYIIKQDKPIRQVLGISQEITSEHHEVNKAELKDSIVKAVASQASYDDVVKALDYFQTVSLARKRMEAGEVAYMVEDEFGTELIDLVDIEVKLREILLKSGYDVDQREDIGNGGGSLQASTVFKDQDLSTAINVDFGLFAQRFLEISKSNKLQIEIHAFVNQLMHSEFTVDRQAKQTLVENLIEGFTGLSGDDDELILISILSLIIQRLIPEEIDSQQASNMTLLKTKKQKRLNDRLYDDLKEWQNVMFDAQVPKLMLGFVTVRHEVFLSNSALMLLNNLLIKTNEANQQKILDLLIQDDQFFDVFYYIKNRLEASKKYLLNQIQKSAEEKFKEQSLYGSQVNDNGNPSGFKPMDQFTNKKYDLHQKYEELRSYWKSEEMNNLLNFLNSLCENCYRPSQVFLKCQVDDSENFRNQKKITSIDLIYQVVSTFTDIVDIVGDYVFSDFRTFAMLPLMMDTLIEFIYGPCLENQIFLGESKKFIAVINTLMDQPEMGNYSGIHQQAKAQLSMLYSCSQLLLAICDIKDKEMAKRTHSIMLDELNIPNLVQKMTDIYIFKVGGDPERKKIYEFNKQCTHFKEGGDSVRCIEGEFCEYMYLIPRDNHTIQTGFNIYSILQILKQSNPTHRAVKCLIRDESGFSFLKKTEGQELKKRIYKNHELTSLKTTNVYNRFNRIEAKLLDNLIIRIFPELYIAYLQKVVEGQKEAHNGQVDKLLYEDLEEAISVKSTFDRQRILERQPEKLRANFILPRPGYEQEYAEHLKKEMAEALLPKKPEDEEEFEVQGVIPEQYLKKQSFVQKMLSSGGEEPQSASDIKDALKEKKAQEAAEAEAMNRKVKMYEFHLAGNFFEDNIGKVEIQREEREGHVLVDTTFQIPAFVKHLTQESRDKIPYLMTKVSQQEKLEMFVSSVSVLQLEMKWQQSLGRTSNALKIFSNQWKALSWLNFSLVCSINLLFILYLKLEGDEVLFPIKWTNLLSWTAGLIQTMVACIVVFSYYLENRATLKFVIQQNQISKRVTIEGYGENYGSYGYGKKKAQKYTDLGDQDDDLSIKALRDLTNKGFIFKIGNLVIKEMSVFVKSLYYDGKGHLRNTGYFILSIYSNFPNSTGMLVNSLLMVDIVFKIKVLSNVMSIFAENKVALISVLGLFLVMLYIFSFIAFWNFKDDYGSSYVTSDRTDYYHSNQFNMYCNTLVECLTTTGQFGIRAGGGIGDVIDQREWDDATYTGRWIFDFLFFMLLNIILMNIFFGIIIDSFAEKRAAEGEIQTEVEDQCFICGISRSKFEIENVPWLQHIYCDHNLHTYLAFLIYVKQKNMSECTGVEKRVKLCLDQGIIEFFPINRTAKINNGERLE